MLVSPPRDVLTSSPREMLTQRELVQLIEDLSAREIVELRRQLGPEQRLLLSQILHERPEKAAEVYQETHRSMGVGMTLD
jgi:hypothetical protein